MAKKKGSKGDFSNYNSGFYEPFAGYHNSNVDQAKYWGVIKNSKGVIPKEFMEVAIPCANEIGKKGQKSPKVGFNK